MCLGSYLSIRIFQIDQFSIDDELLLALEHINETALTSLPFTWQIEPAVFRGAGILRPRCGPVCAGV